MPGFKLFSSDRNQFDGVMLLVNNKLRHDSFPLSPLSGLEATAICLQLQNHGQLIFVSAYLPPAAAFFPSDLDAMFSLHKTIVLAGELNCTHVSWNNASVKRNGNTLLFYFLNNAITINYPNQPTHYVVGPCHHGMARPQVADRGTASDKEGSCE